MDATPPSPWIARFAALVPAGARVLDVACGTGRHARFFATRRCQVVAVDRDAAAIAELRGLPGIDARQLDLEAGAWPLADEGFDAIVVVRYLHRPLFVSLARALSPAGVLLYETFAEGQQAYGHPRRPEFLLAPGELLAAFPTLTVVGYEQGVEHAAGTSAVVQRLAAVGPARIWPPLLPVAGDGGASARSGPQGE